MVVVRKKVKKETHRGTSRGAVLLQEVREVKRRLGKLEKIDTQVVSEEKKIESKEDALAVKQKKLEVAIFQLGKFTFRRKHMLEVIRGVAGSFLGVGLGRQLLNMESLALFLFGGLPASGLLLVKVVIIGSYSAMAGAVSFSLI